MLYCRPNLNLVDNDCFAGEEAVCEYKTDMSFEEFVKVLLFGWYGKIAYDPNQYSPDECIIIRKMANRTFTELLEFPGTINNFDFSVPFGNTDDWDSFDSDDLDCSNNLEPVDDDLFASDLSNEPETSVFKELADVLSVLAQKLEKM